MALSKDLLRVCEVNRIMLDHLDFHCDLEVDEELIEPAEIPRRIIKDRLNPFDLRPLEFRVIFGLSKGFFKDLLDLITPQLTRKNEMDRGNLLQIHRLAIPLATLFVYVLILRPPGMPCPVMGAHEIRILSKILSATG